MFWCKLALISNFRTMCLYFLSGNTLYRTPMNLCILLNVLFNLILTVQQVYYTFTGYSRKLMNMLGGVHMVSSLLPNDVVCISTFYNFNNLFELRQRLSYTSWDLCVIMNSRLSNVTRTKLSPIYIERERETHSKLQTRILLLILSYRTPT